MRRGSSFRLRGAPTYFMGLSSAPGRGRALDRTHDVVVPRAPAEVPLQAVPDLRLRRVGPLLQELHRLEDHPRGAVPALERVQLPERLLDRVQPAVPLEPLDGGELGPVGLDGEERAGLHAESVQEDGAGPALAPVAPPPPPRPPP